MGGVFKWEKDGVVIMGARRGCKGCTCALLEFENDDVMCYFMQNTGQVLARASGACMNTHNFCLNLENSQQFPYFDFGAQNVTSGTGTHAA